MSLLEKYGHLFEPVRKNELIDLSCFDQDKAIQLLSLMIKIRVAENLLAAKKRDGHIKGPVHLGVGQEAIAVGLSAHIDADDYVFGAHRSHGHIFSLNPDFHKLFAEVIGKKTGFSKGMGGSMHLWDQPSGFYGSVPIVAGTVPIGIGTALGSKLRNDDTVTVCYLGDGAVEEGVVHESLNLASLWNLPVIFVVENNLFASHMHISQRQPNPLTARFAEAHEIDFHVIDGNDISQCYQVAKKACHAARNGKGPSFIEAFTYRWYGHVDWRDDIDVGGNRSIDDVTAWRLLDPVNRLHSSMVANFNWTEGDLISLQDQITHSANQAWHQASQDPYPTEKEMLDIVYKN